MHVCCESAVTPSFFKNPKPQWCALFRNRFALALLVLSACQQPFEPPCHRNDVSRFGNFQNYDDSGAPELLAVNERVELRVFAPLTMCPDEAPTFSVQLSDEAGQRLDVESATLTHDARIAFVTVAFTLRTPGKYALSVLFDSDLGVRSVPLLVPAPPVLDEGVVVRIPANCGGVWPLANDAVVCEADDEVAVFFADGGSTRFEGRQVATAGNALWSVDPTHARLERRAYVEGTVRQPEQWAGFSGDAIAGQHGEAFALRGASDGSVKLVRTGISAPVGTPYAVKAPPALFFLVGMSARTVSADVTCEGCEWLTQPLAIDSNSVWSGGTPYVWASRLDLAYLSSTAVVVPHGEVAAPVITGPFNVLPLWVDDALVRFTNARASATTWPRERVLRVSDAFVVLKEDATTVRLVPR